MHVTWCLLNAFVIIKLMNSYFFYFNSWQILGFWIFKDFVIEISNDAKNDVNSSIVMMNKLECVLFHNKCWKQIFLIYVISFK